MVTSAPAAGSPSTSQLPLSDYGQPVPSYRGSEAPPTVACRLLDLVDLNRQLGGQVANHFYATQSPSMHTSSCFITHSEVAERDAKQIFDIEVGCQPSIPTAVSHGTPLPGAPSGATYDETGDVGLGWLSLTNLRPLPCFAKIGLNAISQPDHQQRLVLAAAALTAIKQRLNGLTDSLI